MDALTQTPPMHTDGGAGHCWSGAPSNQESMATARHTRQWLGGISQVMKGAGDAWLPANKAGPFLNFRRLLTFRSALL